MVCDGDGDNDNDNDNGDCYFVMCLFEFYWMTFRWTASFTVYCEEWNGWDSLKLVIIIIINGRYANVIGNNSIDEMTWVQLWY